MARGRRRSRDRSPWKPWAGPAYGSSQEHPPAPATLEQRVPAFLRDVVGCGAWIGSFEGRDVRRTM
jgi:hypothetical protein